MKYVEFTRVPTLRPIVEAVRGDVGSAGIHRAFSLQGLDPDLVFRPNAVLPLRDLIGLFERFARERGDTTFGFFAARSIRPDAFGLFVAYALQAQDLRSAIDRVRRGVPLHQGGTTMALAEKGDRAIWSYRVDLPLTTGRHHHALHVLWQISELMTAYLGARPYLCEVGIEAPAYGPPGSLETEFAAPVRWSRQTNYLAFPASLLHETAYPPIGDTAPLTYLDLIRYMRTRPPQSDAGKTEAALRFCLDHGDTTIEAVAKYLNTGARTLQRRLHSEGLGFRDVLENVRRTRARELLADTTLPLGRIALLLGYSDPSHFTRAYRRWYGHPPVRDRSVLERAPPSAR